MDGFFSKDCNKKISFPLEEYVNTYKKEPEGFEIINIVAQALGCFCFCTAAAEILENTQIIPSFNHPECNFIYKLNDFEKNILKLFL